VGALEVWTLAALVGTVAAAIGVVQAKHDLDSLREGNGVRLVAQQRVVAQGIRTIRGLIWLGLGLAIWQSHVEVSWSPPVIVLVAANVLSTIETVSDIAVGRIVRGV
jgi:hypothetical protein